MQNNKNKIFQAMKGYKEAIEKGGRVDSKGNTLEPLKVLFIAVKGSQNYNLATENSDIDCIAVVKPPKYGQRPISTKISFGINNKDEVDVKDLFTYCELVRKGNCSYIEPIYSKYRIGNIPKFLQKVDTDAKSQYYMMLQKYNALSHPYPSKITVLKEYGIDPKQMHHIERLSQLIQNAFDGKDINDCFVLEGKNRDFLISVKENPFEAYKDDLNSLLNKEFMETGDFPTQKEGLIKISAIRAKKLLDDAKCQIDSEKFPKFNGNDILEEDILNYLKDLDKEVNKEELFNTLNQYYQILSNFQYLDCTFKKSIENLNFYHNIDLSKFINSRNTIDKNKKESTTNLKTLDNVYRGFLESWLKFLINEDLLQEFNELVETFLEPRFEDITKKVQIKYDINIFIFKYKDRDLYQEFLNSKYWKDFTSKNHEDLKVVAGFYQKFNILTKTWIWRFTPVEGIIIPNKIKGKICNLQIRVLKNSDIVTKNKYINFSSSKKVGDFYKYATKAFLGINFISNDSDNDSIIITEGFFKSVMIDQEKNIFKEIFSLEKNMNFDILSLPGLSIKKDLNILKNYQKIYFCFDEDVTNEKTSNKSARKQYLQLISKINKVNRDKQIFYLCPKGKIDDMILHEKKKIT